MIRQAGDTGQLYGSVSTRDIAEAVTAGGFTIERVAGSARPARSRASDCTRCASGLHPEVAVKVAVNVARTEEEALRQAAGENVAQSARDDYAAEQAALAAEAAAAAEALFEGEMHEQRRRYLANIRRRKTGSCAFLL